MSKINSFSDSKWKLDKNNYFLNLTTVDWLTPRLASKQVYLYLFSSILKGTKKGRLEQINSLVSFDESIR